MHGEIIVASLHVPIYRVAPERNANCDVNGEVQKR